MAAPPKPDAVTTEASARAIVAYHRAERWKRLGWLLAFLLTFALLCLYAGYTWGVQAGQLASCWP